MDEVPERLTYREALTDAEGLAWVHDWLWHEPTATAAVHTLARRVMRRLAPAPVPALPVFRAAGGSMAIR